MRFSDGNSLLTLNTRTGVKKTSSSYSSYWMDFSDEPSKVTNLSPTSTTGVDVDEGMSTERVVRLASIRRAIANFVRIMTNDDKINVVFSTGKTSYTDGRKVVISAESSPDKFDTMVGLALHEGAHCLLSDFAFLKNISEFHHQFGAFKPEIRNMIVQSSTNNSGDSYYSAIDRSKAIFDTLMVIMNVIEDRRIDSYVYKNALGYRPYYDAMYNTYFYNKEVKKCMLYDPSWRTISVQNYINWLINIFTDEFDKNAIAGLNTMVDLIDLDNIRRFDQKKMPSTDKWEVIEKFQFDNKMECSVYKYEKFPKLWKVANDIMHVMLQYVTLDQLKKNAAGGQDGNKISITIGGTSMDVSDMDGLENLDTNSTQFTPNPTKKFNSQKAQSAIQKITGTMKGEIRRKRVTRSEEKEIRNLEDAKATIVDSGDKIIGNFPCLVTRKLTQDIMRTDWFPFAHVEWSDRNKLLKNTELDKFITAGYRMGQVMVHRLQVRSDPIITTFSRQQHGKIDRRILSQLGLDIEQVFKRTTIDKYKPAMLHLSIDASGSMSGKKFSSVMSVATALAYVSSKLKNIETVISLRGDGSMPMLCVIYDSRTDTFGKARSLFPYLSVSGSTPEGLCYKATLDMILEDAKEYDSYFINFSDGEPASNCSYRGRYLSYNGTTACDHTKRQVQTMRDAGIKILSYFIGYDGYAEPCRSQEKFKQMYGEDSVFVDITNSTTVLRTLNKLLLNKG